MFRRVFALFLALLLEVSFSNPIAGGRFAQTMFRATPRPVLLPCCNSPFWSLALGRIDTAPSIHFPPRPRAILVGRWPVDVSPFVVQLHRALYHVSWSLACGRTCIRPGPFHKVWFLACGPCILVVVLLSVACTVLTLSCIAADRCSGGVSPKVSCSAPSLHRP